MATRYQESRKKAVEGRNKTVVRNKIKGVVAELNKYLLHGTMELSTGKFTPLCTFGNHRNHGQFSPTDPDKFLLDEDWWIDPYSGRMMYYHHRMWLFERKKNTRRIVAPEEWSYHNAQYCHDFRSGDGTICRIDYDTGAYEADPVTLQPIPAWPRTLCHAHCTSDRQLWVADESPYRWHLGKQCQME